MSLRAVRRGPRKEITSSGLTPPLPSQRFLLAIREARRKIKECRRNKRRPRRGRRRKSGRYKGIPGPRIDFPGEEETKRLEDLFERKTAGRCMQTSPPRSSVPIG